MFRLWGKVIKNNHLIQDLVICDDSNEKRTQKVLTSLTNICYEFDLGVPIWLDKNINEFKRISKTRFYSDSFVENIDFDYLEIQIIEED